MEEAKRSPGTCEVQSLAKDLHHLSIRVFVAGGFLLPSAIKAFRMFTIEFRYPLPVVRYVLRMKTGKRRQQTVTSGNA